MIRMSRMDCQVQKKSFFWANNRFQQRVLILNLLSGFFGFTSCDFSQRYTYLSPYAILASPLCDFLFSFLIKDITGIEFDGKVITLSNLCSTNIYSAVQTHEVVSLEKSIKAISVDLLKFEVLQTILWHTICQPKHFEKLFCVTDYQDLQLSSQVLLWTQDIIKDFFTSYLAQISCCNTYQLHQHCDKSATRKKR